MNVKVFDVAGKMIFSTVMDNKQLEVNTSAWANGMYHIHLTNNSYSSVEKVIVQH